MTSGIAKFAQTALALTLIALACWALYLAGVAVARGLASMSSDVAVAIVAACATASVSVASLVISKRLESRAIVKNELRAKKIPIYESMIATLFKIP